MMHNHHCCLQMDAGSLLFRTPAPPVDGRGTARVKFQLAYFGGKVVMET